MEIPLVILLDVKTRAEGILSPLQSLDTVPQYFGPCQLEMLCTDAEFCILQSYHPETKTSIFFIVKCNNTLATIIKQLIDCILDNNHVFDCAHTILKFQNCMVLQRRFLVKFQHLNCYSQSELCKEEMCKINTTD